jgi:hypothetical protein
MITDSTVPVRLPLVAALFVALVLCSPAAGAKPAPSPAGPVRVSLVPYAAYYSLQTKQPDLIDPWMFVAAPGAPAATALQQLAHAPGIRNALMSDDGAQPAFDANGRRLSFSLQRWFTPASDIEISPESTTGQVSIVAHFANLVPNGRYTLMVVRFNGPPGGFSPLEGTVTSANWLVAGSDGAANSEFTVLGPLTHANAVELIYHSDASGVERGLERADMGINAHVQALVRLR